jgi:hypothetical protein
MHKRHNWTRQQNGCKENPGVWSEGKVMKYAYECKCGATKVERHSIIGGETGALVTINDDNGTRTRDTRNWN